MSMNKLLLAAALGCSTMTPTAMVQAPLDVERWLRTIKFLPSN